MTVWPLLAGSRFLLWNSLEMWYTCEHLSRSHFAETLRVCRQVASPHFKHIQTRGARKGKTRPPWDGKGHGQSSKELGFWRTRENVIQWQERHACWKAGPVHMKKMAALLCPFWGTIGCLSHSSETSHLTLDGFWWTTWPWQEQSRWLTQDQTGRY